MRSLFKNPLTVWLWLLCKNWILQFKHRNKHLRIGYLSSVSGCRFGAYNAIYDNVRLQQVELGDLSYIADNACISRARIGKFCSIGPNVKIGFGTHPANTFVSTHPVFFSTLKQAQVTFADREYFKEYAVTEIGNDVWIGADALLIDGVKIGDGAIVAAGAVVAKDIPPYAIVGGVPAKLIKYRFEENQIERLLILKWWDRDLAWLRKNYRIFHDIKLFAAEEAGSK